MIDSLIIGNDENTFFTRENVDKIIDNPHWTMVLSNMYSGAGDTIKEKYEYFLIKVLNIFHLLRVGTEGGDEWIVTSSEIGSVFQTATLFEPVGSDLYEKEKLKDIRFCGHFANNIKLYTDEKMKEDEFLMGNNTGEKHSIFGCNAKITISDWFI